MNIHLNAASKSFFSFLPSISPRLRPLLYVISALAIGILLYQCYHYISDCLKSRSWSAKAPSPNDEKPVDLPIEEDHPIKDVLVDKMDESLPVVQKAEISFQQLVDNSQKFAARTPFPTQANLIQNFATSDQLQAEVVEHAKATRPVLHSRIWPFIPRFIAHKKRYGSSIEKQLYQDITPTQFVDRLIKNRPLAFVTGADSYLLPNGQHGAGGFEFIGTEQEKGDLCLKNYQSYFEMSLAAFISMFVPTHFINKGDRNNRGIAKPEDTHECKGIYVGMVGARFERPGLMEWSHMMITSGQNTPENGYGRGADPTNPKTLELRLWAELYNSRVEGGYALPDYEEAKNDQTGRYLPIKGVGYLDTLVYRERLKLVIESFLLESNERAKQEGKKAYLHIVGLGLGVWKVDARQTDLMLEVYADLLHKRKFDHISDLDFSWFSGSQKCGNVPDQGIFDSQGHPIKIHFSKREPADKLQGEDEGKLLIAQYAWDGNAYPGNEYWQGNLTGSGDPAAACCSMIPELQNPEINPFVQAQHLTLVN